MTDAVATLRRLAAAAQAGGMDHELLAQDVDTLWRLLEVVSEPTRRRVAMCQVIRERNARLLRLGVRNQPERVKLLIAQTGQSRAAVYRAIGSSQDAETESQ